MKDYTGLRDVSGYHPADCSLKGIFDICAAETFTDEQVERVLSPVLKMINDGRFDTARRPRRQVQPLALAATAAVLTITMAVARDRAYDKTLVYISDVGIPLSDMTTLPGNMLLGRVTSETGGVGGIKLTLENTNGAGMYGPIITGNDGTCLFGNVPDGTYQLWMSLPEYVEESMDAGTWLVENGIVEFLYNGNRGRLWKGVDVQVCLT